MKTVSDKDKTSPVTRIVCKTRFNARNLLLIILSLHLSACGGQVNDDSLSGTKENGHFTQPLMIDQNTTFPQIHTNLNGMVREFVRTIHQDRNGNYWFGTNGDGIIRYDGKTLEKMSIAGISPYFRVLEIVEDKSGNLWFGTSEGLIKYNGQQFTPISTTDGLQNEETWGLTIDQNNRIWVGTTEGVRYYNGERFVPFSLPDSRVENARPMLSENLVFKIVEDRNGTMWFATDGNGIFQYRNGEFVHLTARNELTDNHVADILEDRQGNIWIGTFYGGMSKFDGKTYTNFTQEGTIEGEETYNLYEDRHGNIWFTAEGYGVYRYDGQDFRQFTTEDGLTSNVTLSILEDNKGQVWFGSWQGLSIYDGQTIMNARDKEPWTK